MDSATTTRDAAECLVQLEVNDANLVAGEVEAGDHKTFDDALHYIIERGLAEIKRTRVASEKLKAKTQSLKELAKMLGTNPELAKQLPADLVAALKTTGVIK